MRQYDNIMEYLRFEYRYRHIGIQFNYDSYIFCGDAHYKRYFVNLYGHDNTVAMFYTPFPHLMAHNVRTFTFRSDYHLYQIIKNYMKDGGL